MKADSRMRALALPIPTLPPVFINILPAKNMDEVYTIESLLSGEHEIDYIEQLVSTYNNLHKLKVLNVNYLLLVLAERSQKGITYFI